MLLKENRLRKMTDFDILYKEGKFLRGKLMDVKIWKTEPEKYPKRGYSTEDLKIGFVVSKKVHKSAVKRNRIKRQMREIVRLLLKQGKIKKGYMAALIARPAVFGAQYQDIEKDIIALLTKAGVLI